MTDLNHSDHTSELQVSWTNDELAQELRLSAMELGLQKLELHLSDQVYQNDTLKSPNQFKGSLTTTTEVVVEVGMAPNPDEPYDYKLIATPSEALEAARAKVADSLRSARGN